MALNNAGSDHTRFVPRGVAAIPFDGPHRTQDIHFILQPRFSMLAFACAVEPLRIANQVTGKMLYRWATLSEDGLDVTASNAITCSVVGKVSSLIPRKDSMIFVCSGVEPHGLTSGALAGWVRRAWRHGARLGGLCTGTFALAEAGILSGSRVTTHWENQTGLRAAYPALDVVDTLFTLNGRIMTCGGGAAATDLMVRLIAEQYGDAIGRMVMQMCLRRDLSGQNAPQRPLWPADMMKRSPKLLSIVEDMSSDLSSDADIAAIAARHGLSRRQLERLFKRYIGTSPFQFRQNLRLDAARTALRDTDLSVDDISADAGFKSRSAFSRAFRARFGQRATDLRDRS